MKQTKTYEMPLSEVRSTRIRACILAGSGANQAEQGGGQTGGSGMPFGAKDRNAFPFK